MSTSKGTIDMKLEAKARLQSLVGMLAGVVNLIDRPPSTYMDEAEMDHTLPDQSAIDDEDVYTNLDDARNQGNTGYQPTDENQNLIKQSESQIFDPDSGPTGMGTGMGAAERLVSTSPLYSTPTSAAITNLSRSYDERSLHLFHVGSHAA